MGKHSHGRIASGRLTTRFAIADEIERLIGLLDALDGDPDLEPDHDGEASLCLWGMWADGGHDLEADAGDEPELQDWL